MTVGKAQQQKLDNWSHSFCTPESETNDHKRSACFLLSFSQGHQFIVCSHVGWVSPPQLKEHLWHPHRWGSMMTQSHQN